MDAFEERIKKLPLHEPSANFENRVLSPKLPKRVGRGERRIALHWAVAASLLMGFLGFLAGSTWQAKPAMTGNISVSPVVQIIRVSDSSHRWFDFSSPPQNNTTPQWSIIINDVKGERHVQGI